VQTATTEVRGGNQDKRRVAWECCAREEGKDIVGGREKKPPGKALHVVECSTALEARGARTAGEIGRK